MKSRCLSLQYEVNKYSNTIKDRKDCIRVILETVRSLLYNSGVVSESLCKYPYLKLVVNNQSRIYVFLSDSKFYSFSFNCQIEIEHESSNVLSIYTKNGINCTFPLLSQALSIISEIRNGSLYDVYSSLDDEDITNDQAYRLLDFFWGSELGYLRYDYDKKNHNGLIHPLNHFDVNITEQAHYKIGLEGKITPAEFENIVNEETDCFFLVDYQRIKSRIKFPLRKRKRS